MLLSRVRKKTIEDLVYLSHRYRHLAESESVCWHQRAYQWHNRRPRSACISISAISSTLSHHNLSFSAKFTMKTFALFTALLASASVRNSLQRFLSPIYNFLNFRLTSLPGLCSRHSRGSSRHCLECGSCQRSHEFRPSLP